MDLPQEEQRTYSRTGRPKTCRAQAGGREGGRVEGQQAGSAFTRGPNWNRLLAIPMKTAQEKNSNRPMSSGLFLH